MILTENDLYEKRGPQLRYRMKSFQFWRSMKGQLN